MEFQILRDDPVGDRRTIRVLLDVEKTVEGSEGPIPDPAYVKEYPFNVTMSTAAVKALLAEVIARDQRELEDRTKLAASLESGEPMEHENPEDSLVGLRGEVAEVLAVEAPVEEG